MIQVIYFERKILHTARLREINNHASTDVLIRIKGNSLDYLYTEL